MWSLRLLMVEQPLVRPCYFLNYSQTWTVRCLNSLYNVKAMQCVLTLCRTKRSKLSRFTAVSILPNNRCTNNLLICSQITKLHQIHSLIIRHPRLNLMFSHLYNRSQTCLAHLLATSQAIQFLQVVTQTANKRWTKHSTIISTNKHHNVLKIS